MYNIRPDPMLWRFEPLGVYLEVSKNSTPKSSILIGFSLINHPFWGTPIFGNTHFVSELFLFSKMWMKMLGNFDSHHCQPCFRGILLEGQNSEMMECFHSCRIFCDAFGSMLHSAMQKRIRWHFIGRLQSNKVGPDGPCPVER